MTTLVLVGPHGSGKTTLGCALARNLRWVWHEEIGRTLRDRVLAVDPAQHAARPQADFDRTVFEAEILRDRAWPRHRSRIVETWHPGNLAYASLRSGALATTWAPRLERAALCTPNVLVQPLTAGTDTLAQRRTEPGPAGDLDSFFRSVGLLAVDLARTWRIPILPPVHTDRLSVLESRDAILTHLAACL